MLVHRVLRLQFIKISLTCSQSKTFSQFTSSVFCGTRSPARLTSKRNPSQVQRLPSNENKRSLLFCHFALIPFHSSSWLSRRYFFDERSSDQCPLLGICCISHMLLYVMPRSISLINFQSRFCPIVLPRIQFLSLLPAPFPTLPYQMPSYNQSWLILRAADVQEAGNESVCCISNPRDVMCDVAAVPLTYAATRDFTILEWT